MDLKDELAKAPRPLPQTLRATGIEYVKRRRAGGEHLRVIADELGLNLHTIKYWLKEKGKKKNPPKRRRFQRVFVAQELSVSSGDEQRRFRAELARGVAIDGLTLSDVAQLAKELA